MSRKFNVVIERDEEDYYVASVPSIPGCHSQARSLDDLMDRVREAIEACSGQNLSDEDQLQFAGVQRIRVPV